MEYYVYAIDEDIDPSFVNAYIGVTNNLSKRWRSHSKSNYRIGNTIRKRSWDQSKMRIVFTGSAEECFAKEAELRPHPNMGLNIACGGLGGHTSYTAERNEKISLANKGRKNTWVTKDTFKDRDFNSSKNPNAKHWLLTGPNSEIFELKGNLSSFCEEHDLLESCLRRHTDEFVPEPQFSGYGGFRAKNENSLRRRLNTTGWRLQLLSST